MCEVETVVIEIQSRYKDMTGAGIKETSVKVNQFAQSVEKAEKETKQASAGADKFTQSVLKMQAQSKKATVDLADLAQKAKSIASKAISIPVKVLDYATKPLRGIFNFMTSIRGVITTFLAGQVWNKAISGPLALADAYKSAFIGFQTLFKSQDRAQKMMNDLDTFARTTPFKTSGVIAQSQKMLAMGWNPDNIIKDMKTIGNAAAATGKGDEGLERISLALSQIKSKGKLSTEELNQLAEAGIGAKRYIAEGLGLGSDDKSLQKMTKLLEGGKIGADQAIGYILKGMEEYNGMMEKTSKETLSGIKSNLEDTFEINIFRKWGLGLQEGAKQGLGVLVDLLDKNQDKLSALGDQFQKVGSEISLYLADKVKAAADAFMELSQNADFRKANVFGKISMAWDKIVAKPFSEWWGGAGGEAFRKKADELGQSLGNSIAQGVFKGIKGLFGNAAKLIPGGQGADALSWLSGGLLLKGAQGLGITKLLGKAGGKLLGGGAAAGAEGAAAGVSLGTAATVGGFALGGVGLVGAINDMKEAAQTINNKTRQDYMVEGATKAGMVAAGTALGAAIGSIIPGLGTLIGAAGGAAVGGLGSLIFGGGLGKAISDAADGTAKLHELSEAASGAKKKVDEAHSAASDFKTLVDQYKQVNFIISLAEAGTNPAVEKGLADKLTEIQTQAANIEAKLKDGGLNKTDKATLQGELDAFNLQEITIKAVLGQTLDETQKTKLTDRITELEKEQVEVDAKLSDTSSTLTESEKSTLNTKKVAIEAELTGLKAAVGTLDTTDIDGELAALQADKQFLLNVKKGSDTLDDSTRKMVDKALSDINIAELTLNLKASGLSDQEVQAYKDKIAGLGSSMIEASNGLLTQYDLEHQKMDVTIDKLNTILKLKEQEAKIADADLMQNVYNNRGNYKSYEDKLSSQEKEYEGNYAEADKYMGMYDQLGSLQSQIKDAQAQNKLNGVDSDSLNDFGLTDDQTDKFNKIIYDLGQKNPYLSGGMDNPRAIMDGLLGEGSPLLGQVLAEAQKYNLSATQGTEQYYNTQGEYGNLYGNELDMIQRNLEHRYGGTYQELSGKFFTGSNSDRNAFVKMLQGINALGDTFSGLDDGFKFTGDKIVESLKPFVTGDVVQAFAGRTKVNGTDPLSLLNNYIIDLAGQGKSGIFEADKASVTDVSGKISGGTATKDEVKSMQGTLSRYGYLPESGIDGLNGPKTQAALKKFQDDISSGKLTLDTLPDSVTKATGSIDGMTTAASAFVSWINGNLGGGSTNPGGNTSGVTGHDAGAGAGPGTGNSNGVAGTIASAGDAMSSAASDFAAKAASAAASTGSLSTNASGASSQLNVFQQKLANLKFPSGGGGTSAGAQHEVPKANGGITSSPEHALIGEDGPEAIIPLSEKRRGRGMSLWKAAGAALGVRMYADGGIVGGDAPAPQSAGAAVSLGGVNVKFEIHGGGDSASVVEAIKEKMDEVANAVAENIAGKLEKSYSNMPVAEG